MEKNPVILIVEDDQYNYDLLEVILMGLKPRILWARNAAEGLKFFKAEKVDIVLMDIKLPDRNGYDLTRDFKKMDNNIPVIAQTAYALTGDREKAFEAGCDEYMAKPIRKAKFLETIHKHLNKN